MEDAGDRTLRAKYLDWCSARLAEQFLDLSTEEVYALAHPDEEEAPSSGSGAGSGAGSEADGPALPSPTHEGYRDLVQRVTESLLVRTPLPTYEQWSAAYQESPERFDPELLGFWKELEEGEGGD